MDRLSRYTPLVLLTVAILQVVSLYFTWSAEQKAQTAQGAAWQAANQAMNANNAARSLSGVPQQLTLLKSDLRVETLPCRQAQTSLRRWSSYGRVLDFQRTYHEVLLEAIARKTGVDLEGARKAAVKAARKAGHPFPERWRWLEPVR